VLTVAPTHKEKNAPADYSEGEDFGTGFGAHLEDSDDALQSPINAEPCNHDSSAKTSQQSDGQASKGKARGLKRKKGDRQEETVGQAGGSDCLSDCEPDAEEEFPRQMRWRQGATISRENGPNREQARWVRHANTDEIDASNLIPLDPKDRNSVPPALFPLQGPVLQAAADSLTGADHSTPPITLPIQPTWSAFLPPQDAGGIALQAGAARLTGAADCSTTSPNLPIRPAWSTASAQPTLQPIYFTTATAAPRSPHHASPKCSNSASLALFPPQGTSDTHLNSVLQVAAESVTGVRRFIGTIPATAASTTAANRPVPAIALPDQPHALTPAPPRLCARRSTLHLQTLPSLVHLSLVPPFLRLHRPPIPGNRSCRPLPNASAPARLLTRNPAHRAIPPPIQPAIRLHQPLSPSLPSKAIILIHTLAPNPVQSAAPIIIWLRSTLSPSPICRQITLERALLRLSRSLALQQGSELHPPRLIEGQSSTAGLYAPCPYHRILRRGQYQHAISHFLLQTGAKKGKEQCVPLFCTSPSLTITLSAPIPSIPAPHSCLM
jgi:hypothetical protein